MRARVGQGRAEQSRTETWERNETKASVTAIASARAPALRIKKKPLTMVPDIAHRQHPFHPLV